MKPKLVNVEDFIFDTSSYNGLEFCCVVEDRKGIFIHSNIKVCEKYDTFMPSIIILAVSHETIHLVIWELEDSDTSFNLDYLVDYNHPKTEEYYKSHHHGLPLKQRKSLLKVLLRRK